MLCRIFTEGFGGGGTGVLGRRMIHYDLFEISHPLECSGL